MFRLCIKYLNRNRLFYLYIVVNLFSSIMMLALPFVTGVAISRLTEPVVDLADVLRPCIALCLIGVFRALLLFIANRLYVNVQAHAGYRLNADVLEHVQKLPQSFFAAFDAAYANQQINQDANNLLIFAITSTVQITSNAVLLIAIIWIVFAQNITLGSVCVALAFCSGLMYVQFRRRLFSKSFLMREQQSKFFSDLQAQLADVDFIRRHALFRQYRARLEKSFGKFYPAVRDAQKVNFQFDLSNSIIAALAHAALFSVGVFEIVSGDLQVGFLVSVMSYYESLSNSVQFFLTWGKSLQENRVCYERLRRILDINEEDNGEKRISSVTNIELENVSCSWQEGQPLLRNVSVRFEKGKLYGIVGANGCGKSTLLDVLLGLGPENNTGVVRYDGVALQEVDKYYLRENCVGITEQDSKIISDSLLSNLTLFSTDFDRAALDEYLDLFGLRSVVCSVSDRTGARDDQRGRLSGGEEQKIGIVRQLLQMPAVMLFDEPTSALDARSRSSLTQLLVKMKSQRIIILVSHDEELLNACDVVIPLDS